MKTMIALFFFFSSIQAFAISNQRYTDVSLAVVSIDQQSPLHVENILDGSLVIDHYTDSAKLILNPAMPDCPTDMFCATVMPAPLVIEFANLQVKQGPCGSFVFSAVVDSGLRDGLIETIEIVDNTYNVCHHLNIVDQFEVTYSTYSSWTGISSEAKFKGPKEGFVTLPVQPLATM